MLRIRLVHSRNSLWAPSEHTGALGLIMTLGGKIAWRAAGVFGAATGVFPPMAYLSGMLCDEDAEFCEAAESGGERTCPAPEAPPSFGGSGLFLESFKDVVDADGVPTGDCAASLEAFPEGEAVPSLLSLFFLDALFGSLLRESWSCCV